MNLVLSFSPAYGLVDDLHTVFAGMRAWALSTNWMLSSLVLALSLLPLAVNLVCLRFLNDFVRLTRSQARFSFGISGENVPIIGCEGTAADPTPAQVLLCVLSLFEAF